MSQSSTLSRVELEVRAGQTMPEVEWQQFKDGVAENIAASNLVFTLYYRNIDNTKTYWKKELTKSTPATGKIKFSPSANEPFAPAGVSLPAELHGDIYWEDTTASKSDWFIDALHVHVKPAPGEP